MTVERLITVTVNGERRSAAAEPRTLLVDFIRHGLGLTGTHVGCEQGGCGACTVLLDGELALSCCTLAVQADGATLQTIEGLAPAPDRLHPLQTAFQAEHGLQCGYCTPGMLIVADDLLRRNPDPSEAEIRSHLSGNVCRCTGYTGIVAAVQTAARSLRATAAETETGGGGAA